MNEALAAIDGLALLAGFLAGIIASALFFAGLAWGMRRALDSPRPALLLLASFLLRATLLLGAGLALAQWLQPLSCWAGYFAAFLLVRTISVRRARAAATMPLTMEGR